MSRNIWETQIMRDLDTQFLVVVTILIFGAVVYLGIILTMIAKSMGAL